MFRNSQICVRNLIPHIRQNYQKDVLTQFESIRISRFSNKRLHSSGSFRNSQDYTARSRIWGKCSLVVIGACVGAKLWLINSDCQGATGPGPSTQTQSDPPRTEGSGSKGQTLAGAIIRSRDILQRVKDEIGSPGIVVGVSVDGEMVWSEGLGYSDVENRVPCCPDTVMRIASISKPITSTIVGKLMEEGLLDIDKPIQEYVPKFPEKIVEGEKVTMTTRQVLTHMSGIRHYSTDYMNKEKKTGEKNSSDKETVKETKSGDKPGTPEMELVEMLIKKHYNSVDESLNLFKDDPLVHKPGSKFLYSSHGYTLVSAVIEGAAKKPIKDLLLALFKDLGLQHTYLDEHTTLIYNRSRYYIKTSKGQLINAPYVDLSYKWSGGGLMSTVGDLVKFGNIMLYSYQYTTSTQTVHPNQALSTGSSQPKHGPSFESMKDSSKTDTDFKKSKSDKDAENEKISQKSDSGKSKNLSGYMKRETIEELWKIGPYYYADKDIGYGLGWYVVPEKLEHGCCRHQRYYVSHTGAAMGASSVLLMVPGSRGGSPPSGVVVAIMTNMISVALRNTAVKIAQEFENVEKSK